MTQFKPTQISIGSPKLEEIKKNNAVYILLDRSGSMIDLWSEAQGAVDAYVSKLPSNVKIYYAVFDNEFEMLFNDIAEHWPGTNSFDVYPRGMTALYDSAAKVINQIFEDKNDKSVFVIMTDGCENSSREYTLSILKEKMKELESVNCPTVYLGAEFKDVEQYAGSTFNIPSANIANITRSKLVQSGELLSAKTRSFYNEANSSYSVASVHMNFTADEKKDLEDEKS